MSFSYGFFTALQFHFTVIMSNVGQKAFLCDTLNS